ncbi:hypothetical protein [Methylocucumis oryzae]|nr:hypothetical protein [Methylocucumis oryzae]
MICDKKGEVYTIRNIIKPEDWNIDASKYINEVLIHKVWHDPGSSS